MAAFGPNFPNFRAIWLGTTKPKLQNRYGAADQNIQTFISNLGYLWLTRTSWIDSAPSEPSNSSQSGHTGTNVASFRQNEITKMTPNSAPTDYTVHTELYPLPICIELLFLILFFFLFPLSTNFYQQFSNPECFCDAHTLKIKSATNFCCFGVVWFLLRGTFRTWFAGLKWVLEQI